MFVIRLILASMATMIGVTMLGIASGYTVWQGVGLALFCMVMMQALILVYVAVITLRKTAGNRPARPNLPKRRNQFSFLHK